MSSIFVPPIHANRVAYFFSLLKTTTGFRAQYERRSYTADVNHHDQAERDSRFSFRADYQMSVDGINIRDSIATAVETVCFV